MGEMNETHYIICANWAERHAWLGNMMMTECVKCRGILAIETGNLKLGMTPICLDCIMKLPDRGGVITGFAAGGQVYTRADQALAAIFRNKIARANRQ